MRMRSLSGALGALLLVASCARFPVTDEVRIQFSDSGESVVVTADTSFEMNPANELMRRRVDVARAAAIANNDPWAVRFAGVRASADSALMRRDHGVLEHVTRSVTIRPDDLQLVFADTNITVKTLHADGWREVSFYPGSSTRATREQQRQFNAELEEWSWSIARYFRAVHDLYSYLDRRPQRAKWVFAAILGERNADNSDPVLLEDEQPLVAAVTTAMEEIAARMDASEGRAATFAEEADLLFNPFPARVTIQVPGTVLASEGFIAASKGTELVIEPVDLFGTLGSLEGKWIAPDPLAALLREQALTSDQVAVLERRSTSSVSSVDIAREIRTQLERPRAYTVRWRE